jgi:ATP-dependent helicase HrpA
VDGGTRGRPGTVAVRVLDSRDAQHRAMRAGTRRLLLQQVTSPAKGVLAGLSTEQKLALASAPHPNASALFDDCLAATVDDVVAARGGPAWTPTGFAELLAAVRAELPRRTAGVVTEVARVLGSAREVDARLRSASSPALLASLADARAQLGGLVHPGFVTGAGVAKLPDLERYLAALLHRLEKLPERPQRDQTLLYTVQAAQEAYDHALERLPAARREDSDVTSIRWMIEELRVSLFGGGLRTAYPISPQRITKALAALGG